MSIVNNNHRTKLIINKHVICYALTQLYILALLHSFMWYFTLQTGRRIGSHAAELQATLIVSPRDGWHV